MAMSENRHVPLEKWLEDAWTPSTPGVLDLLKEAHILDVALIGEGSNYTFLARLEHPKAGRGVGVYKPGKGEAPLYDFPWGTLYKREYASYLLSRLLGWPAIPPTVIRDGPQGAGSLQLYILPKHSSHFFAVRTTRTEKLKEIAVFDMVANNADRKGGHIFEDTSMTLWSIDHGLTFHEYPKLRTVIWDYAGEMVPPLLLEDLRGVCRRLNEEEGVIQLFRELLEPSEVQALRMRIDAILAHPVFPDPTHRRSYPWPLV
jgi:uncharacterized repeat protein (TIGR03843 family)